MNSKIIIVLTAIFLIFLLSKGAPETKYVECAKNLNNIYSENWLVNGCSPYGPSLILLFTPLTILKSNIYNIAYSLFLAISFAIILIILNAMNNKKTSLIILSAFFILGFADDEIIITTILLTAYYLNKNKKYRTATIILSYLLFTKPFITLFILLLALAEKKINKKIFATTTIILLLIYIKLFGLNHYAESVIMHIGVQEEIEAFINLNNYALLLFLIISLSNMKKQPNNIILVITALIIATAITSEFHIRYLLPFTPLILISLKKHNKKIALIAIPLILAAAMQIIGNAQEYYLKNLNTQQYLLVPSDRTLFYYQYNNPSPHLALDLKHPLITDITVYVNAIKKGVVNYGVLTNYTSKLKEYDIIIYDNIFNRMLEEAGLINNREYCYTIMPFYKNSDTQNITMRTIIFKSQQECYHYITKLKEFWEENIEKVRRAGKEKFTYAILNALKIQNIILEKFPINQTIIDMIDLEKSYTDKLKFK